jgi:putative ABC transport system permease protein
MTIQTGLLLGFAATASSLIDRAHAQLWVSGIGVSDVDQGEGAEVPHRTRYLALSVPGIQSADKLLVRFRPWRRPEGGTETVIVVGVDPKHPILRPWNLVEGSLADLNRPDGIIIDKLYAKRLGISSLGDIAEINGHRARIVGFTDGVRTFTQSPYVFASLKNAKVFSGAADDRSTFLLVRTTPGVDPRKVQEALSIRLPNLRVWTASEFSWKTRWYWLFGTGAGFALVLATALGLIVGTITVIQTLYATTVERLSEYATLRAMGAPGRFIYGVILRQALLSAIGGYVIGMGCSVAVVTACQNSNLALLLPPSVALGIAVLTVAMCTGAATFAIRRALRADPAMVFK